MSQADVTNTTNLYTTILIAMAVLSTMRKNSEKYLSRYILFFVTAKYKNKFLHFNKA